jgi:hypothetical protein
MAKDTASTVGTTQISFKIARNAWGNTCCDGACVNNNGV